MREDHLAKPLGALAKMSLHRGSEALMGPDGALQRLA